ncbi:Myb-like DNA-binding domain containing protein [Tritrichomonas foetus]|uniref:Myb-like DNA-binding domain containing protein n=1 Tax=Tritrichomonas foetus TaxID=1144522 RepID=A0A1J4JW93_9EUKA|nr:Myb-like DNA-binding domain containing protein [Tritrichomonas foetus]|eukprot:OHT01796.1 Myb-like DNA-binding domain containing protein [Tritrichomonas foetus]
MDDPNIPDEQPPTQSVDSAASLNQIGLSNTINPDLLTLILQMQSTPIDKTSDMINRGSWSQQEDDMLINAVEQLGPKKWTDIAKFVPSRTSKQCRERWFNRLCPDLKHEPFEPWEDNIIIQKQREIGNRWAIIARELPGRSTNSIKNRWYSGLKTQHELSAQITLNPMTTDLMQHQMASEIPPEIMQQQINSEIILPAGQDLNLNISVHPDNENNPPNTDL